MDGRKFVTMLPENDYVLREMRLAEAIKSGDYIPIEWAPVNVSWNGKNGVIYVASDALMVGRINGVRVSATPRLAQEIADHLGYFLPTTHIADLIYKNAVMKIAPQTQGPPVYDYVHMHRTSRMLAHHDAVERAISGLSIRGLVDNAGKHWVLTNHYAKHMSMCANYGWHHPSAPFVSASGIRVMQPLGFAHNAKHVDYSQTIRLVHERMLVNGAERSITEVGANPDLCGLVSSEGPLKYWRIPAALAVDGKTDTIPAPPKQVVIAGVMKPGYKRKDPRYLQRGDYNDDVAAWQAFLGIKADRDFGPQTFEHTRSFQRRQGLLVDGIVGPKTLARANEILDEREAVPAEERIVDSFIQAKHYRAASRKPGDIKWIVIHTAEIAEKGTSAEAIGSYFATMSDGRVASAHFTVDTDSIVQSVKEKDIAYHAPGANLAGLGIEHAGYAKQTKEQWQDDYSMEMLKKSSRLTSKLCREWQIPMRWVDRNGLLRGEPGITTHNEVSQAFKKSTHYDPGPNFPMDGYIEMVKAYAEAYP
jgi:N-acetyl-anhydromuramyl-L-alanine amidase AmpD